MPERMMVTCPGCDGVVYVTPTGDEAEVRCPECDEVVYARNAQSGAWWANPPVADPTGTKPLEVSEAVAAELPGVVHDGVSTPQTEISEAPTDTTSPPSVTDWFLGAVIASICAFLLAGLIYVAGENKPNFNPPGRANAPGSPKFTPTENRMFTAFVATAVFMFSVARCTRSVLQRRRRVNAKEAADLVRDSVNNSSWLRYVAIGVLIKKNPDSVVGETTSPDEESGPPLSSEANEVGNSFYPRTEQGLNVVGLLVVVLVILIGWFGNWVLNFMNN